MARGKRRANGEGSVFQYGKGWRAYFNKEDGNRHYAYGKTQQEARQKRDKAWQEYEAGQLVKKTGLTVADVLHAWLETKQRKRYNTCISYDCAVRNHIEPALGHIPVQKLDTQDIERFVNSISHLAPRTVRQIYTILSMALKFAVKRKYIGFSPCQDIDLPGMHGDADDIEALDADESRALLAAARGHKLECLITLAITSGLRRGELLALHWDHIDFKKRSLRVEHTLIEVKGKGYVEMAPKTKDSKRTVQLPDVAIEALKKHRARQTEQKWVAGDAWQDKGLVFCNDTGGYLCYSCLKYHFPRLMKKAGLLDTEGEPLIHFHGLRHSAATLLADADVPPKVIQEMLGHTTMEMTGRYMHASRKKKQQAAATYDVLFGAGQSAAM
jgi:integrase